MVNDTELGWWMIWWDISSTLFLLILIFYILWNALWLVKVLRFELRDWWCDCDFMWCGVGGGWGRVAWWEEVVATNLLAVSFEPSGQKKLPNTSSRHSLLHLTIPKSVIMYQAAALPCRFYSPFPFSLRFRPVRRLAAYISTCNKPLSPP